MYRLAAAQPWAPRLWLPFRRGAVRPAQPLRRGAALAAATVSGRWLGRRRRAQGEAPLAPAVVTGPEAPTVGAYTVRSTVAAVSVAFAAVEQLGHKEGPQVGEEVWLRARVATVRVKGKSTFVVLRQNSLHTVQACKFKDKEDEGASAAEVAKFFKSLPLDGPLALIYLTAGEHRGPVRGPCRGPSSK